MIKMLRITLAMFFYIYILVWSINSPLSPLTSPTDNNYSVTPINNNSNAVIQSLPRYTSSVVTSLIRTGEAAYSGNASSQGSIPSSGYSIWLPLVVSAHPGNIFYVDSILGSDTNPGTSPESAWRTLAKVNAFQFQPGDTILFKRNGVWAGPGLASSSALIIHQDGSAEAPITYGAYGAGSPPIIMNSSSITDTRVVLINASWIVLENLILKDAHLAGIDNANTNSHNNIFRNLEITNVGEGIALSGSYHLVTQNYIHDLFMVVNTPGGGGDDWGANGVDVQGAHNEVSFNQFVNCEAPSYDYGMGGGAIEIYQMGDYTSIHHNWSLNTAGYMEVGSIEAGSAKNVTISYNVILNSTVFTYISLYTTQIQNFRVENNTIVDLRTHDPLPGSFISFGGSPAPDTFIFRNNIVYIKDYYWVSRYQFTHQYNLYYLLNPKTTLGFSLGTGELIADPQFTNLATFDFHLISISPAIDVGENLGYTKDFDQNPVPINDVPDLGAFEYQGN